MGSAVITKGEKSKKFKATDASAIKKSVSGTPFKLIKSRLPLKNAFRIGAGALKHKKVRLVLTVILSVVAFTLFGLSDLFSDYDNIRTCANSIMDTGITYASVTKSVKMRYDDYSYWDSYNRKLSDEDIAAITGKTGVAMTGVYSDDYMSLSFNSNFDANVKLSETNYTIHANRFSGFTEMTMADLTAMGYNLAAGSLPDGGRDEIAVSVYVCETFIKAGYSDGTSQNYIKINSYSDMVGKTLNLNGKNYMITGVIDTHFNFDRYLPLTKLNPNADNAKMLINYALYTEYSEENAYSFCAVAFTGKGFAKKQGLAENGAAIRDGSVYFTKAADSQYQFNLYSERLARLSDIDASKVIWLDGERETLGKKEIIIYSDSVYAYSNDSYPIEIKNMTEFLKENGSVVANISKYRTGENIIEDDWKIVGYIETPVAQIKQSAVVCGDWLYDMFAEESGGAYGFAVGVMPETYNGITGLLKFCYNESGDVRYPMRNAVVYELDNVKMILEQLSKVFLYIGLFFAFFASVLLATFIASSVAYKKQDIGILRAIGSRSNDVFRIFFSESFVIAFTNFVLSALGTLLAAVWINVSIRNNTGLLITVLSFGIRQLALLFVISMGVAFVASFLPVRKIAAKKPIDAIRNR